MCVNHYCCSLHRLQFGVSKQLIWALLCPCYESVLMIIVFDSGGNPHMQWVILTQYLRLVLFAYRSITTLLFTNDVGDRHNVQMVACFHFIQRVLCSLSSTFVAIADRSGSSVQESNCIHCPHHVVHISFFTSLRHSLMLSSVATTNAQCVFPHTLPPISMLA